MNFNAGDANYSFRNKEDFETYCEFTGIKLLDKNKELGNGSVIMSSLQASNRGMEKCFFIIIICLWLEWLLVTWLF